MPNYNKEKKTTTTNTDVFNLYTKLQIQYNWLYLSLNLQDT